MFLYDLFSLKHLDLFIVNFICNYKNNTFFFEGQILL